MASFDTSPISEQVNELKSPEIVGLTRMNISESGEQANELKSPEVVGLIRMNISEVFVYQLKAFRHAGGHRAEDWGLDNPVLTGQMKLLQCDDLMLVQVFGEEKVVDGSVVTMKLKLFAECPITLPSGSKLEHFVQSVADSSRYFVLRVEVFRSSCIIFRHLSFVMSRNEGRRSTPSWVSALGSDKRPSISRPLCTTLSATVRDPSQRLQPPPTPARKAPTLAPAPLRARLG